MTRIARLTLVTLVAFAGFALAGCSDDSAANPFFPTPATPQARVMAVHASPDAPAVDLLVDGAVAGTGLAYPGNTGYLAVDAGTRNVKVNVSGTATSVIEANLPLTADVRYSVFAIDSVASIEALVVTDDLTAPAAGKAHVRFIHLSPNAPPVDVAVTGGPILFGDRAFRSFTAFTPVDAGTYDLEVRPAGSGTVVLSLPGVMLQTGRIYTVFARGFLNGSGAQALGAGIIVND